MIVTSTTGIFLDSVLTRLLPPGIAANTNAATGIAVLIGTANWGPTNDVQLTNDPNEWASLFGGYETDNTNETTLFDQMEGFYMGGKKNRIAGGGKTLYTIKVDGSGAAKADLDVLDNATSPGTVGTGEALYTGAAGNGIALTTSLATRVIAPPAVPVLTGSASGGTLAAATHSVSISEVNNVGETLTSTTATVTTSGSSSSISVALPTPSPSGIGFNVYSAPTSGGIKHKCNSTPATGAAYVITVTPPGSVVIPTVNTAIDQWNLVVAPFDNRPAELYKNLEADTVEAAVNGVSSMIVWTAGASTLIPTAGTAYLTGGDSGLATADADYIGTAGDDPTGLYLGKTVDGVNFIASCKMSSAIKAAFEAAAVELLAQTVVGPNTVDVTSAAFETEADLYDDWAVIPIYAHQKKYNSVTNLDQAVLPIGSVIGAACNGPYWASLTQCKLLGYLGPWKKISRGRCNELAGHHILPIGTGSVLLKGSNSSHNESINQIEDLRIPVKLARDLDATITPLLGEPQVVNRATGESAFFKDIEAAIDAVFALTPGEAIEAYLVEAKFDPTLAQQNKARIKVQARQTGKANTIYIDLTAGRTVMNVLPPGAKVIAA